RVPPPPLDPLGPPRSGGALARARHPAPARRPRGRAPRPLRSRRALPRSAERRVRALRRDRRPPGDAAGAPRRRDPPRRDAGVDPGLEERVSRQGAKDAKREEGGREGEPISLSLPLASLAPWRF